MARVVMTAFIALMPAFASASVIVETATGSQFLDSSDNGSSQEIDFPTFNKSLGTLDAASIAITAHVSDIVSDPTGTPHAPSAVDAKVSLDFASATSIDFPTQNIRVVSDGLGASVSATFSSTFTPSSLSSFLTANENFFIPEPNVFIRELSGPDSDDAITLSYNIAETLTYTPVPEPGSFAPLAVGFLVLGSLTWRRRTSARLL